MTADRRHLIVICFCLVLTLALAGCSSNGDEKTEGSSAVELYQSAKTSLRNGNYQNAIFNYRQLQSRFPFGRYTEQAQLELAYCYYKNLDPGLAVATLDRFLRTYPTHPNVDYAYYLKGLTNFSLGQGLLTRMLPGNYTDRDQEFARRSFQDFAELLRRYPDSRYADDTRQRMAYLRALMADYEITVGRYYLRRGAYVGAANRAKYVLETFNETPAATEAVAILSEAYRGLELAELSDDALRVLRINEPQHPYITGQVEQKTWIERLWPFD